MPTGHQSKLRVLQGTLDLMILRTLASMGPQHAYGIATRLEQLSRESLRLNQGTLFPALVKLELEGCIKGSWSKTSSNREAKFYEITRTGRKALERETVRWRQMAGFVEKVLCEE